MPDPRREAAHLEAARLNVRAFLESQPAPDLIRARLEDLPGVFSFMASEHVEGQTLTPAQEEACQAFRYYAACLTLFLEAPDLDALGVRGLAHSFAAQDTLEAFEALPEEYALGPEDITDPEAWGIWYARACRNGQHLSAAKYAACWHVAGLILQAGNLEEGEAEDQTAQLLEVLAFDESTPATSDPSLN